MINMKAKNVVFVSLTVTVMVRVFVSSNNWPYY